MRHLLSFSLATGLFLAGCAQTLPPIEPLSAPPPAVGTVAEEPVTQFTVAAQGEPGEDWATVEARLLRAAAERALIEGQDRFRVLSLDIDTRRSAYAPRLGFSFGLGGRPRGHGRWSAWNRYGVYDPWPYGRRFAPRVHVGSAGILIGEEVGEGADVYDAETTVFRTNRTLGAR